MKIIYANDIVNIIDNYYSYSFHLKCNHHFKIGDIIQSGDYFFYCGGKSVVFGDYYRTFLSSIDISNLKNTNKEYNYNLLNECFRPGTKLEIIKNYKVSDYSDLVDFEKYYILPYKKKIDRLKKMERIIYG